MSFSARLYEASQEDVRVPRHRTHIEATAIPAEALAHYVVVHNLSTDGILVESHDELHRNVVVVFDIPGLGRVPARVAWHGDIFYGCAFLDPIDQALIDAKLADAKVVWPDFAKRGTSADAAPTALFPTQRTSADRPPTWQQASAQVIPIVPEGRWAAGARFAFIIASAAALWAIIAMLIILVMR